MTTKVMAAAPEAIEPERYELLLPPPWRGSLPAGGAPFDRVTRRQFFTALGPGLVVVAWARGATAAEESGKAGSVPSDRQVDSFLHLGKDGIVTGFSGKAEVGQNARTALAQAVAEELRVPLARVRMVMADTQLVPYDRGTFGSRTTPEMAPRLRRAAACARQHLIGLAAKKWKVAPEGLRASEGFVVQETGGRKVAFAALTGGKRLLLEVDDTIALRPPSEWTVYGQSAEKLDARAFVTGAHRYTSDVRLPETVWVGKVLRPPRFGARLLTLDPGRLRDHPGAILVRAGEGELGFVGVVAPDALGAEKALAALAATWSEPEGPAPASSDTLFAHLRATARRKDARVDNDGDVDRALTSARHRYQGAFTAAYIAHVPLEPRVGIARWSGDQVTAWTGTQRPFGVRDELAEAFKIAKENVRVIVPDTGSGYGGKHTGDAAVEAARLARGSGKPVRVAWTREEEFTWAYLRPAGVVDIRAGLDGNSRLSAWHMETFNAGGSGLSTPYVVAARRHTFVPTDSPLRQGSYRGLAATFNHFAREVAMDELAALAKLDPIAFRKLNLTDARLLGVLEAAVARFGWPAGPVRGRGVGVAIGAEKGGYVATCAEVDAGSPGTPRVVRLVTAFECGAIVNPRHLTNQIEGSVIMGLGGALTEAITFANGRLGNPRLSQYEVPRFGDLPALETVLVNRPDLPPAGAGETPIVAVAPAIANAIFAATGKRHRALPMRG